METLKISEWFWSHLEQCNFSRKNLVKKLSSFSKEELERFQGEWKYTAIELAWCHELYYEDGNERYDVCVEEEGVENAMSLISLGRKKFEEAFRDREIALKYFQDCGTEQGEFSEDAWKKDCDDDTFNDENPEHIACTIYDDKYEEEIVDGLYTDVDDMIDNGYFKTLATELEGKEKFHEYKYNCESEA